jgi:hypothetical protein
MPRANQNQTNGSDDRPTRERDYGRLLDDASLMLDGIDARIAKQDRELRRLLGNHQNAAQIMQMISRPGDGYAASVGKRAILDAKMNEYRRGLARQRAENPPEVKVSDIPVNPDDHSSDVPNGKVAVAV